MRESFPVVGRYSLRDTEGEKAEERWEKEMDTEQFWEEVATLTEDGDSLPHR